jgi:hypothetical protein
MKVKIGNIIYDSSEQPIMLILENYNKEHISNMPEESHKYCEFPDDMSESEAREFMRTKEVNNITDGNEK